MLKKLVNEAHCVLRIKAEGPLLIKSGYDTVHGANMTPVVTYRYGRPELYLPGSSLKGVFRSHIEKVICSLQPQVVCNPFLRLRDDVSQSKEERQLKTEALSDYRYSCGDRFERLKGDESGKQKRELSTSEIYKESCPACRLFGSTSFIGRIAISDAHLVDSAGDEHISQKTERRDGIGIDRLTGGTSHGAKFEMEVITTGVTFETTIHLRNFEIWQLGMLFIVIQDMEDQLIYIGSGRSRGLGKVTASFDNQERDWHHGGITTISMLGSKEPGKELRGLGAWLDSKARRGYGVTEDDRLVLSAEVQQKPRGIRNFRSFKDEALSHLKADSIEHFIQRMRGWSHIEEREQ